MIGVFLVCDHSIFGQGLRALLRREPKLDLLGEGTDVEAVRAQIEQCRPDVLILHCSDGTDPSPALVRCVKKGWVRKIITISYRDNTIHVFTSEQRVVHDMENLLEAIGGNAHGAES